MGQQQEMVVATEVAELEFNRFCDEMDLDVDESTMDADDLKSFSEAKKRIVREIEAGRLSVDEKGQPTYTPRYGDSGPLTFYRPSGETLMAMDGKKKDHDVHKFYAVIAAMTKKSPGAIAKLDLKTDLKVAQTIAILFLA